MKKYVAGLMFSVDKKYIALIIKNKPEWQAGLLNGIGGKIELEDSDLCHGRVIDNSSIRAMCREFEEETGLFTEAEDWNHFLTMSGNNTDAEKTPFSVDFYRAFTDKVFDCRTMEVESVVILRVDNVIATDVSIENLKWLIMLALDSNPKFTQVTY